MAAAAVVISAATASGRDTYTEWLPGYSLTVAPARSAMARCAGGGIIRSSVEIRYQPDHAVSDTTDELAGLSEGLAPTQLAIPRLRSTHRGEDPRRDETAEIDRFTFETPTPGKWLVASPAARRSPGRDRRDRGAWFDAWRWPHRAPSPTGGTIAGTEPVAPSRTDRRHGTSHRRRIRSRDPFLGRNLEHDDPGGQGRRGVARPVRPPAALRVLVAVVPHQSDASNPRLQRRCGRPGDVSAERDRRLRQCRLGDPQPRRPHRSAVHRAMRPARGSRRAPEASSVNHVRLPEQWFGVPCSPPQRYPGAPEKPAGIRASDTH